MRPSAVIIVAGLAALVACSAESVPATTPGPAVETVSGGAETPLLPRDDGVLLLDIPARDQAPERPAQGWCAETAIQEALLYYGQLVPQSAINAAGKPRMPDLYWGDVPVALRALGLRYSRWSGVEQLEHFLGWIRERLGAGEPVLAGVKLYPTATPRWGLDHIVLIVGIETDGALLINTTWGTRQRRTVAQLMQTRNGISLSNRHQRFFAYAIKGRR